MNVSLLLSADKISARHLFVQFTVNDVLYSKSALFCLEYDTDMINMEYQLSGVLSEAGNPIIFATIIIVLLFRHFS